MTWQIECACGAKAVVTIDNVPLELGARMVDVFNEEHGANCSERIARPDSEPPQAEGARA